MKLVDNFNKAVADELGHLNGSELKNLTKDEILAQAVYQRAINEFASKSIDFDRAAKVYCENKDPQKETHLAQASKSAWALYCYQMSNLLYLADHIKDEDTMAAIEAAKDLRQIVFNDLQGKYEYIRFITKPQNP